MGKKSEHGNVIEIVIIVVLLLAVGGLVAWRFLDGNKSTVTNNQESQQTSTNNGANSPVQQLKQFKSQKHNVSFSYPSDWTVSETVRQDFSPSQDAYPTTVVVKNAAGKIVVELGSQGQFGGSCPDTSPYVTATTVTDKPLTISGLKAVHFGYSVVQREDKKSYQVLYGLNNGELPVGAQQVQCEGMSVGYKYIVQTDDAHSYLGVMTFGSWNVDSKMEAKSFTSLEEAKAYAASDEMKNIEAVVSSLKLD